MVNDNSELVVQDMIYHVLELECYP